MMLLIWLIVIVLLSLGLLVNFYICRKRQMNFLKNHKIPGPAPNLIWGNMPEYYSTPNVLWDSQLIEKYGPICGYYVGAKPVILIADPQLIRKVQEINAGNFLARPRRVPGGINPDPNRAKMLGNLPVHEWKDLRRILSPSFRPSMLKHMNKDITELISVLMNQLEQLCHNSTIELDMYPKFQDLTLDLIGRTGFGVHLNFQGNLKKQPLKAAIEKEFLKRPDSIMTKLCLYFPDMWILQRVRIIFQWLKDFIDDKKRSELWKLCLEALRIRMDSEQKRLDILQTMLDSTLRFDDAKIVANSVLIFEAAFETLSAGLAFTINLLMNNIDVQNRVRDEIRNVLKNNDGQLSVECIKTLKYLGAVIKEALRIYPPQTTFISRSGEKDFVYKKDDKIICTIPKDVQIQIALYQIQNSPNFWDEPEVFKPERHLNDAKDSTYSTVWQPFGQGQRKCIGYSYANVVLPMVLATILSKYSLSPSLKTEKVVTMLYKTATMTPKNGCFGEIKFDPLI